MESKVCMNLWCLKTTTHEWKTGWLVRSGGFADLCFTCGQSALVFCEEFHSDQSGWRVCKMCGKHLHCGCIASELLIELLDNGAVSCTRCANISQLRSLQSDAIPTGFGSLNLELNSLKTRVAGRRIDDGNLAQSSRFIVPNESNLLPQSKGADLSTCLDLGPSKSQKSKESGNGMSFFSNATRSSVGPSKFA